MIVQIIYTNDKFPHYNCNQFSMVVGDNDAKQLWDFGINREMTKTATHSRAVSL